MILKKKQHGLWNNSSIILFYSIFSLFYLFFSDYINKNVAPNKNIEKDWILNTLPVSFSFNLK